MGRRQPESIPALEFENELAEEAEADNLEEDDEDLEDVNEAGPSA